MMFILGLFLGSMLGILMLGIFVANKPEIDRMEFFDDGVAYAVSRNKINGTIIATNNDEIMVEYTDGMMKRFRDVTSEKTKIGC